MAIYKVNWRYYSSIGGPWMKGDMVQVDEALAEAINKDSPGVLTEIKEKKVVEGKPQGLAKGKDRQVKKAETRMKEPLEAEGVITKADFKAVKD